MTWTTQVAFAGLIAACLFAPSARAQGIDCPTDAWIATTSPVYYEGRADYWYDNHWCYRDGNGWAFYNVEPGFLLGWRNQNQYVPQRQYYEGRGGGGWGGHVYRGGGSVRSGGGGARGGGRR